MFAHLVEGGEGGEVGVVGPVEAGPVTTEAQWGGKCGDSGAGGDGFGDLVDDPADVLGFPVDAGVVDIQDRGDAFAADHRHGFGRDDGVEDEHDDDRVVVGASLAWVEVFGLVCPFDAGLF